MNVVITEAAWGDMLQIGRYIATENAGRAETFLDELFEQCEKLAYAPEAYQLVPGREASGIRRKPYGKYLIFYRTARGQVEVLHVLHGARDYESLLFPDE